MKKRIAHFCALALCFSFLLGVRDGRVALWKNDDPKPIKVFPYPVSMLPEEARKALANGVQLESEEQLYELIEKYLS